jgi:hypothetical protein
MDKSQQTNQLLIAGVKSYPGALIAMTEFRRLALKTVQDAVESNLKLIATSMGVELSPSEIQKRFKPKESEIGEENAKIGVTIRRDAEGWKQYYQFYWERESFYFTAIIRFKEAAAPAASISEVLNQIESKFRVGFEEEERELFMSRQITSVEMRRVSEILPEVLREWANLWKRLGGLKGLNVNEATIAGR